MVAPFTQPFQLTGQATSQSTDQSTNYIETFQDQDTAWEQYQEEYQQFRDTYQEYQDVYQEELQDVYPGSRSGERSGPRPEPRSEEYPEQPRVDGVAQNYTVFREYNDANEGDYLNTYRCVDGISKHNCLKYCAGKESCGGVEWNPIYGQRSNVCCPIRTVKKYVPRQPQHRHGHFYLKENKQILDPTKIYIYK
jgi:hypothetical protein